MSEINGIEGSISQGEESVGQLFPSELDIARYVGEAVRGGMDTSKIADAVFAGFQKVDKSKASEFATLFNELTK